MKEIKTGWNIIKISEICEEIVDCLNRTAPKVEYQTEYKMLRTSNIKAGYIDTNNVKYVEKDVFDKWTRRSIPQKGDILLTREAPLGEIGMIRNNDNVFLGQRIVSYRIDNNIADNRYIYYLLLTPELQGQIKSFGMGSTVEHMRVPDSKELLLNLPPLLIQNKIASVLSKYDDLIENNNKRIKLLEETAQAIYEEWFVNYNFPGNERVEMVDSGNDDFGMIPEEWKVEKLDQLDVQYLGRGVTPKYEEGSGFYAINQKVNKGSTLELQFLKELRNDLLVPDNKFCYNGDVLINSLGEGTIGRIHYFKGENKEYAIDQHMSIFRSNFKGYGKYIYFYLSSKEGQQRLQAIKKGGTNMTMLNISDIRNFNIIAPSKKILNNFSNLIDQNFQEIYTLDRQNKNLKETRDLLIPRLVNGELDVESLDVK